MKVAYFGFPHLGGTFQVFRYLRAGLLPFGTAVQWVGLGEGAHHARADPQWSAEMAHGFAVGARHGQPVILARQLVEALDLAGFDAVLVNVLADAVQTNVVRYLPRRVLRILVVHNITPGTYCAAGAVRDHVHATVAISPRIRDDLLRRFGFESARVVTIPHGTDIHTGASLAERDLRGPFRLLFLGRIEDQSKGVLALPDIVRALPPEARLTIAGDGPDLAKLKRRCLAFGERITFLGGVRYDAVGELLARHHAMIMPSRFEGFGLTLIEAMAAGCVPVVSQIRGVTDWIVQDGCNGLVFPVGSTGRAAEALLRLHRDRNLLGELSRAARVRAEQSFSVATMASRYQDLLTRLEADPPAIAAPLPLSGWEMPKGLRSGLRTHLPTPVKNLLRRIRENAA